MKKVIRLTESDLARIVKRVLMEEEGFTMQGMKLAAVNFPGDGVDAGEVRLTDGKKELAIYGKSTIPYSLSKGLQIGYISGANSKCKGRSTGTKISKDCTVFISMNNYDEYECKSDGCTPR